MNMLPGCPLWQRKVNQPSQPLREKRSPLGEASIAPGYTPDAVGAPPRTPAPRGGERKTMSREKRKTEIVTIRMTPTMKSLVQHLAQKAGMTVTDYMTVCALGKEIVRVDGLNAVLSELKAQGRNLNQLTTLANMGKLKILRGDDLVDGYAQLCQQVSQLSKEVK